ncbi:DUF3016 domain-containing protein [Stenotrophomonas rhizophila]|uniref:DUF3016 domain-containing protein n=1 Tax=Stenotrophomonas rhizophila TaxID=216778 RepID=UPI001E2B6090|nr:DUF3016 domain-containing protein [Stenotrophomonas rhizophila]MCC7634133.1 DUF3016 domain-containing protein [Stenotrophomonas rhizophila]MCC7662829.1 DUF3016 domain-containing protein [Stenotrophomonas rhizophila]
MKRSPPLLTGTLACLLAIGAAQAAAPRTVTDPQAPRALAGDSAVQVQWTDPAQFSEIRQSSNRFEAERGNWVEQLAQYLRSAAGKRLAPGQSLEVTITDIERAGDYEPWHGPRANDIRILRDLYPPRISLTFSLRDAQGQVLAEGERKLSDSGYLHNLGLQRSSDPLRYEKKLLDDWLQRELRGAAGR